MKILFCKISAMKYYKGAGEKDIPINGGSYVDENGFGHEQYNYAPVESDEDGMYCLGFVETKTTSNSKRNDLHVEKIAGCELLKKEDFAENVLVVWCATTLYKETSIMGWYNNATVYRTYQGCEFANGEIRDYNVIAKKEDCVLLPEGVRRKHIGDVPTAKKRTYGFGQSMIWYATEEKAKDYIQAIAELINQYDGENWIDKSWKDIKGEL